MDSIFLGFFFVPCLDSFGTAVLFLGVGGGGGVAFTVHGV